MSEQINPNQESNDETLVLKGGCTRIRRAKKAGGKGITSDLEQLPLSLDIKLEASKIYDSLILPADPRAKPRKQVLAYCIHQADNGLKNEYSNSDIELMCGLQRGDLKKAISKYSKRQPQTKVTGVSSVECQISILLKAVHDDDTARERILQLWKTESKIIAEDIQVNHPKEIAGALIYNYFISNNFTIDRGSYLERTEITDSALRKYLKII